MTRVILMGDSRETEIFQRAQELWPKLKEEHSHVDLEMAPIFMPDFAEMTSGMFLSALMAVGILTPKKIDDLPIYIVVTENTFVIQLGIWASWVEADFPVTVKLVGATQQQQTSFNNWKSAEVLE